ncbi:unnamed protein product [Ilex paraguariensis]|uniref:Uncharacterized protein n=1 Tax=Ilex paraguariensis TaxID=185542 RepID=A0ABC8RHW3_9AQUA
MHVCTINRHETYTTLHSTTNKAFSQVIYWLPLSKKMARSLECTLTLFLVFLLFGSSFFEARPLDVSKPPNNIEEAMEEVLKGSNFEVSKTKGTTARTLVQIKEAGPSPPGQGHHQSPHGPPPSPGHGN